MQYPFQPCVQRGWRVRYEDKLAVISHSTKCSEGVADLVSASLFGFWFVGLFGFWFADLGVWFAIFSFWFAGFCIWFLYFSFWFARFLVSDSWDFGFWFADLVSDSRVLVSDSLLLIRGKFLIRGLFRKSRQNLKWKKPPKWIDRANTSHAAGTRWHLHITATGMTITTASTTPAFLQG